MKPSMKILHVVVRLDPGGMENGIANLAKELHPRGYDFHVACLERAGDFVQRMPCPNQVYVLGKREKFAFSAVLALARLIRRIKPDVVHSHNIGPLIYSGLATCGGILAPVLQGEHAEFTEEECQPRRIRQRHIFYGGCRKIHAVAEGLRQQMIQLGFVGDRIVTIANGVDTQRFAPGPSDVARRKLNLPEQATIIGIVGRFGMFKRHDLLISAFNQLAQHNRNLHLLVIGSGGSEQERIVALARSSAMAERIHITGLQNEVAQYYRAMDLLVSPSVNEGMSNAVLEAMSCGRAVLVNDTCGNSEIINTGSDGVIADLGTEEKLRCELQKVLVDPARLSTMGQMARAKIEQKFSLSGMVENYRRLYHEVARMPI